MKLTNFLPLSETPAFRVAVVTVTRSTWFGLRKTSAQRTVIQPKDGGMCYFADTGDLIADSLILPCVRAAAAATALRAISTFGETRC